MCVLLRARYGLRVEISPLRICYSALLRNKYSGRDDGLGEIAPLHIFQIALLRFKILRSGWRVPGGNLFCFLFEGCRVVQGIFYKVHVLLKFLLFLFYKHHKPL